MNPIYASHQVAKEFIDRVNYAGGPLPENYLEINAVLTALWVHAKHMPTQFQKDLMFQVFAKYPRILQEGAMGNIFSPKIKDIPGNHEMMAFIYSTDPVLEETMVGRWDRFVWNQFCSRAVRDRSAFLRHVLTYLSERMDHMQVLDVPAGNLMAMETIRNMNRPCRYFGMDNDVEVQALFKESHPTTQEEFCLSNVFDRDFVNIGRGVLPDLVWCAGLFDYIDDRLAFKLLKKLLRIADINKGIVVVGNLDPSNPTKPVMDLLGWRMVYRTQRELHDLAYRAIYYAKQEGEVHVDIGSDVTGIQNYLILEYMS